MDSITATLVGTSATVSIQNVSVDGQEILVEFIQDGVLKSKRYNFGKDTIGPRDTLTIATGI